MKRIESMLRERIGLDVGSIGAGHLQRTARLRMKSLGLKVVDQYHQLLLRSSLEWNELVESVVVAETWFFRDREPFASLVRLLLEDWFPAHPAASARLLSLPCSSGEEPYSMVMALLDAGVAPERFEITGIDISRRALAHARRGVYGRNSFRGTDFAFRERYFRASRDAFTLSPSIRDLVRFYQGNLLGPDFLAGRGAYDFVFCRNLLIYFDPATQQQAVAKVADLLSPSGVLFVGPAEVPLVTEMGFVSANIPMAFACRKARGPTTTLPTCVARSPAKNRRHSSPASPSVSSPPREAVPAKPEAGTTHRKNDSPTGLDHAKALADSGRFAEAAAACEACLRRDRESAPVHYLLGLVRDAVGEPSAMDCYRKAVYLDPTHHEALLRMSALAEKHGDLTNARAFRRRAERIKKHA